MRGKLLTLRKLYDVTVDRLQCLSGVRNDTGFLYKGIHAKR